MSDNPESWENKSINFRMPEKSKQMLKQDRVSTTRRVIKRSADISIKQQHCNSPSENRQRSNKKKGSNNYCSDK
jgi:hypothetical protein